MHRRAVIAVVAAWSATGGADALGPQWRIHDPLEAVFVAGDRLVSVSQQGLQIVDPHDGSRGLHLIPEGWGFPVALVVAGGRIIAVTDKPARVYAFATPRKADVVLATRWELDLAPGERAVKLAADLDLTVVEIQTEGDRGPVKRELVAIAGGTIAWRHQVGTTWAINALSVHAGRVAVAGAFGNPGELQTFAFELDADGLQRWSYDGDTATGYAAGDRFVAIAHDPYLTIIDRAGGVPFDALIGPLGNPVVTIVDDIAYVTGESEDDDPGGVVAVALAERRLRWRHAVAVDRSSTIAISATTVFVHSHDDDDLVALDRTTGVETWRYGLGTMADLIPIGDRLVVNDSAGAVSFGPIVEAPPLEDAVVTGKLTVACAHADVVTIAGHKTSLGRDGRFRARIRSRGVISVMALDTRLVRVDLVGRHRYDVGALSLDRCED